VRAVLPWFGRFRIRFFIGCVCFLVFEVS
jgi:hypothetical protein